MNRRHLLAALSGAAMTTSPLHAEAQTVERSLKGLASAKGLVYGAAVATWQTDRDATLRRTFSRQCAAVVPEWEMKWGAIEGTRGQRNYTGADRVVSFASSFSLKTRGHAAIWHRNLPRWVEAALKAEGEKIIIDHIRDLMAHYKGKIVSWDIVNEAIEPKDGQPDSLRNSVFLKHLGRTISRAPSPSPPKPIPAFRPITMNMGSIIMMRPMRRAARPFSLCWRSSSARARRFMASAFRAI